MRIDIDTLNEAELVDLNRRIVARLKLLHDMKTHVQMLDFRVGEKVSFQPDGHALLFGIITKYNRKTVSVITETGAQWNVAPVFLRKLKTVDEADAGAAGTMVRRRPG
ncbi:hypothetical protein CLD22_22260 [Rubrivivax gelatinosus]|nr:hypothetical protein [Rubrivivax gelatinosus]